MHPAYNQDYNGYNSEIAPNLKVKFFDPAQLDKTKRRPRSVIYSVYHCCKYLSSKTEELDRGAWSSLIIKHPINGKKSKRQNTTIVLSSYEGADNHVRIRLNSILETLSWITGRYSNDPDKYTGIEVILTSTDIFLVNLLREWLQKWSSKLTDPAKAENSVLPNKDILGKILAITSNIHLTVKWQSEKSIEMELVARKVDSSLVGVAPPTPHAK